MELKDKKCIPCHNYVPPISLEEKEKLLRSLDSEWSMTENNSRLKRRFKFKNFKKALALTNVIGAIAEEEKHHPDIKLGWGYCEVEIWTHANNNLLENDFILASKIDLSFKTAYPEGEA